LKRLAPKYLLWGGLLGFAAWSLSAAPAWADSVVTQTGGPSAAPADIATLLAPMLAAALGIERLLETAWNLFESLGAQVVAVLGLGKDWAAYARKEVQAAQAAFATALGTNAPPDALKPVADALINAQSTLRAGLDSDQYQSIKQAVSIIVGIVLGIGVSTTVGIDMLQELHLFKEASLLGEILTGIIIGTGSAPVHSLIGLLQQSRDALDQAANLFNKRAGATLRASAENQPAPGVAPALGVAAPGPGVGAAPAAPSPAFAFHLGRLAHR